MQHVSWKRPDSEKNILVVEDDSCMKTAIERIVRKIDRRINFQWASSAEEALGQLNKKYFDLVISDYNLPGLENGLKVWEASQIHSPHCKFVMMSGMGVSEYLNATRNQKYPPSFLPKPFSPIELRAIVIQCIGENISENGS